MLSVQLAMLPLLLLLLLVLVHLPRCSSAAPISNHSRTLSESPQPTPARLIGNTSAKLAVPSPALRDNPKPKDASRVLFTASPAAADNATKSTASQETLEKLDDPDLDDGDDVDDGEDDDEDFDDPDEQPFTPSGILAQVRLQRARILKGGLIELIEWLFVFILVAPGTMPLFGCILYSCTNCARRRLGLSDSSASVPSRHHWPSAHSSAASLPRPSADHPSLVPRARHKVSFDDREDV